MRRRRDVLRVGARCYDAATLTKGVVAMMDDVAAARELPDSSSAQTESESQSLSATPPLGVEEPEPSAPCEEKKRGELNAELGRRGEDAAARFLYRHGYEILERNWTCAAGEADIIARDGDWVVFVEVKTRTSIDKGFPSEAVDRRKRSKYEKIAALFLAQYDVVDVPVRFDVVSLVVVAENRAMLRHHINAFAAG